jgi:uncharacterized protein (UPF0335 family)
MTENQDPQIGGIAADALRQFISRIENLEEEKSALSADIKDVYSQCKSQGFDTKIVRKIVSLRKKDRHEREEEDQILELYLAAIGEA